MGYNEEGIDGDEGIEDGVHIEVDVKLRCLRKRKIEDDEVEM